MHQFRSLLFVPLLLMGCALVLGLPHNGFAQSDKKPTPDKLDSASKIRAALARKTTWTYNGFSMRNFVNKLKSKTGIQFKLDRSASFAVGIGGRRFVQNIRFESNDTPLRKALGKLLSRYRLAYVVLGDHVLITTPERGLVQQLRQTRDIHFDKVNVKSALDQLADTTGVNIFIDPNVTTMIGKDISIKLDQVSAENGVRMVAFVGGLKCVRCGKTLVITTAERAKLLPTETPLRNVPIGEFPGDFDVPPGFPPGAFPGDGPIPPGAIPPGLPGGEVPLPPGVDPIPDAPPPGIDLPNRGPRPIEPTTPPPTE